MILVAGFLPLNLQAQIGPEFEVVSIKPTVFNRQGAIAIGTQVVPGTTALNGIKLKDLIARAFSLQPYQVTGPGSLDEQYYDILAKSAPTATDSEQRQMLQRMLADRFGMASHKETKEIPCYELVVGDNGPKIRAVTDSSLPSRFIPNASGIRANSISLQRLADLLTPKTDRPVLDKTGLAGTFDIDLKWATSDTDAGPSLFKALQEQLGLKLRGAKAPIETLVVDRIYAPSEN